jgi:hypothetical protein
MLNFPDTPVLDDEFVSGDITYVFDGQTWNFKGDNLVVSNEYVLKIGDTMQGALLLPIFDPVVPEQAGHKKYIDESIAAAALYQGVWQVAANVPDLTPTVALPQHTYSWIARTVDPAVAEVAPVALPGIGGQTIGEGDTIIWNANTSIYEVIRSTTVGNLYVVKSGDVMSGALGFSADTAAINFNNATSAGLFFNDALGAMRFRMTVDNTSGIIFNAAGQGNAFIIERDGDVVFPLGAKKVTFGGSIYFQEFIAFGNTTVAQVFDQYFDTATNQFRLNASGVGWIYAAKTDRTIDFWTTPTARDVPMVLMTEHNQLRDELVAAIELLKCNVEKLEAELNLFRVTKEK